jgi:hypothetical protein
MHPSSLFSNRLVLTLSFSKLFCMAVSALMMASCTYGFGQHMAKLSPANKLMTLKVS